MIAMDKSEGGFTLVEVLVSVFVASIVIGVLAQSYIYATRSFERRKLHSVAVMIANVNLERYKRIKNLKERSHSLRNSFFVYSK